MSDPSDFPSLLLRVRKIIDAQYGPTTSRPFLMLCDLLAILEKKKVDRVPAGKDGEA